MVAFFRGTGYSDILAQARGITGEPTQLIPVDQARALLYYTFAAQEGDYGAQMALGYRHWTGIGVNEDCLNALEWYEAAAHQCEYWKSTGNCQKPLINGMNSYGTVSLRPSWWTDATANPH